MSFDPIRLHKSIETCTSSHRDGRLAWAVRETSRSGQIYSMSTHSGRKRTLLAGLAFQVFSFVVFLVVLAWTLVKARKSPKFINKGFIAGLVMATLAVYLRACFRLAETAEGLMENLSTHEVFFGCLEFAPIVVDAFVFIYWHPGRWLKRSGLTSTREK